MATSIEPTTSALPADFEDFEQLLAEFEAKVSAREGEIIEGTIIEVTKDFVTVDIGYKSEGQIPIEEFADQDKVVTVAVGDKVDVYLERQENDHGQVELSKEKADRLKIWDEINLAVERDELVEGTITGRTEISPD